MDKSNICICGHPQDWHGEAKNKKGHICHAKFCKCSLFRGTFFSYDSSRWSAENKLTPIKEK